MLKIFSLIFFLFTLVFADSFDDMRGEYLKLVLGINSLKKLENKRAYELRLDKEAKAILKHFKPNKSYIFDDLKDMKNPAKLYKTYKRLRLLSLAFRTPACKLYKNKSLKEKIIYALFYLRENAYFVGAKEYKNWWPWEIGIPKVLNELLAMFYKDFDKKQLKYLLASSFYFQPLASYSGSSKGAKYSTQPHKRLSLGANRADTAYISFVRGILLKDKKELQDAKQAALKASLIVSFGNGFYKDASFIQHGCVPYLGTYGAVLIDSFGALAFLAKDTKYKLNTAKLASFYELVLKAYGAFLINGLLNDSVSGRAISRKNTSEKTRAKAALYALALLAVSSPKEYKTRLNQLVRNNILKDDIPLKPFYEYLLSQINSSFVKKAKKPASLIFYNSSRVVHNSTYVLAMHDKHIAAYESMNSQNTKGFFTSSGMIYSYKGSKAPISWDSIDLYHLPGVTNSQEKLRPKSYQQRCPKPMSKTSFAGGVSDGLQSFVGYDYISGDLKTKAKKSWFFIADKIIALGSNITSTSGSNIHTTLQNTPFKYAKAFSYQLLDKNKQKTKLYKNYQLSYIDHAKRPKNASYAYVQAIKKLSKDELASIKILSQNENAHALSYKDFKLYIFWKSLAYEVAGVKSYNALALMIKKEKKGLRLCVSDPRATKQKAIAIEIPGSFKSHDEVLITRKAKKSKIKLVLKNGPKSLCIRLLAL